MGVRLPRRKHRNRLVSLAYRLSRLLSPLSPRFRLRMYLDLEWILGRLALEESFRVFDRQQHPVRTAFLAFVGRHLRPNDRVLDVGCKEGETSVLLAPRCREVVGIDLDGAAITRAKACNAAENVTYLQGDGVAYLAAQAGRFDVVVMSHVIEHLDDPGNILTAAARNARGIYVEVPDFDRDFASALRSQLGSDLVYSDADHVWEFDRQELAALVASCGLRIVDQETCRGVIRLWCNSVKATTRPDAANEAPQRDS